MFLEERVKLLECELEDLKSLISEGTKLESMPAYSLKDLHERNIMSRGTAYHLSSQGRLKLLKKHGRTFVSRDELERYFREP